MNETVTDLVCFGVPASETVIVALLVPAVVGVPVMVPVEAPIERPAGRPVALHVYPGTPPLACICRLKALFATVLGCVDGAARLRIGITVRLTVVLFVC